MNDRPLDLAKLFGRRSMEEELESLRKHNLLPCDTKFGFEHLAYSSEFIPVSLDTVEETLEEL